MAKHSTKTPLFSLLRHAANTAFRSNDIPVAEHLQIQRALQQQKKRERQEIEQEKGNFSRRSFLRSSALAGAGLFALQGSLPALAAKSLSAKGSTAKIAIIGAGMAGLNAAWTLKKHGIRAEVYEVSKRIGGRMMSAKNVVGDGLVTELGGEFIDGNHHDMLSLVDELGLELIDTQTDEENEYKDLFFVNDKNYNEVDIIEAFGQHSKELLDVRRRYTRNEQGLRELDAMSIADMFQQLQISGWLHTILETAYSTEFGLDISELSALQLLDLVPPRINKQHLQLYNESDERYKVVGGNDSIPLMLAQKLGNQVHTQHLLISIKEKEGTYKLKFERSGASEMLEVSADYVICTLPFSIFRQLTHNLVFSEQQTNAIKELGYGSNSKLVMGFNKALWRESKHSGSAYTDSALQLVWDSSRGQHAKQASLTCLFGGQRGISIGDSDAAYQTKQALPLIEKMLPGIAAQHNQRSERFLWWQYRYAMGSYSCFKVGQQMRFGNEIGKSNKNFFFAGEHCSSEFQGFMNGAAETGRKAAQEIIRRIKR